MKNKKNKNKQWKGLLLSAGFLSLVLLGTTAISVAVRTVNDTDPVSPALCVIAEENEMAKAGVRGNPIAFEHDDFARAMNLATVSEITVTQVPPISDGELRLGSVVVGNGQSIRGDNLSLLSYVASDADIATSSFRFRVGSSPVEMTCRLYLLEKPNQAPTLSMVPKASLNVSTHRDVTLYGTLPCYDPEGDETIVEIVSYPSSGFLILKDRHTGEYVYLPKEGASGKDSFTYVARDRYGNYSASATVSLSVLTPSTSASYADLRELPCHHAALSLTEAGIMNGMKIGSELYFHPTQSVTRGEFVVMAMKSLGMTEVMPTEKTVFSDDAEFSLEERNFVGAAYELGYVHGEYTEGGLCFSPDREITRAEAAVILGNMIDAATPTVTPVFDDSSEIPAWAASSVYSLSSMGILPATDGNISPMSSLTRGDAAMMLHALIRTTEA
ncbi:MAG: S-layer homology domain-containing protein [Clostridia bacterium]|nr:S-layer homology domain-containing protein [Clostridia bacterium]